MICRQTQNVLQATYETNIKAIRIVQINKKVAPFNLEQENY